MVLNRPTRNAVIQRADDAGSQRDPALPRRCLAALGRGWRFIGTALSFILFGIGGLGLALIVFPLLGLVLREPHRRRRIFRRTVTGAFLWFREIMRGLGVLRYRIEGREHTAGHSHFPAGCLIVANHPSLIDVIFLLSVFRDADCVVKAALWRNPFTRGPLRGADYIPNSDPARVVEECVERLRAGRQLILFPEGTRTAPGQPPCFKGGAAYIALRADCRCLPVRLTCEPITLTKGRPWYRTPRQRVQYRMQLLPPFPVAPFLEAGPPRLVSQALTAKLKRILVNEVKSLT